MDLPTTTLLFLFLLWVQSVAYHPQLPQVIVPKLSNQTENTKELPSWVLRYTEEQIWDGKTEKREKRKIQFDVVYRLFTIYDCRRANVSTLEYPNNLYSSEPWNLQTLWRHKIFKHKTRTGIPNGTVDVQFLDSIFRLERQGHLVSNWDDGFCYDGNATPTKDRYGNIFYADNDLFVIEQPAKRLCEINKSLKERVIEFTQQKTESNQALVALQMSRHNGSLEDWSKLFINKHALYNMAILLETCVCGADAPPFVIALQWIYRKYISRTLTGYAIVYTLWTVGLATYARMLGIGMAQSLRVLIPALRRLADLRNF